MADPVEIAKEITIAWLGAYNTDLALRRQKGVVPLFTPTVEEVTEFMSMIYKKVIELTPSESLAKISPSKKKSS